MQCSMQASSIIKLNIGGHYFTTRLQTLTKDPNSMLAGINQRRCLSSFATYFKEPKERVTILSGSSHQNFYEGVHYPTTYFRYIIIQGKKSK